MRDEIDWLIVTAANRAQGLGYVAELRARAADGALDACRRWCVVPDAGNRRIGSGASTLLALLHVARRLRREGAPATRLGELFAGRRLAIVHCGGDSRRLPAYAAHGKVFLPLPRPTPRGRPTALFDLILDDLARLPRPASGGCLVATGDVLLDVAPHAPNLDRPGLVGVAFRGDAATARRHGVYVADAADRVVDFLQKPDRAEARARHAIDADDRMLVDTGLLHLDPDAIEAWLLRAGARLEGDRIPCAAGPLRDAIGGAGPPLDLYATMLTEAARSDAAPSNRVGWIEGLDFHVAVVPECLFLHLGTSRELIDRVVDDPALAERLDLRRRSLARGLPERGTDRVVVANSIVTRAPDALGARVLVEACRVAAPLRLAGENLLVGLPGTAAEPIELPRGVGLVCLPIGAAAWSAVLLGIDDDFKTDRAEGGSFAGRPLHDLLRRSRLDAEALWPAGTPHALWDARLWLVGPIDAVLAGTLWMARPEATAPEAWRGSERLGISELAARVSHRRLLAHRAGIVAELRAGDRLERVLAAPWRSAASIAEATRDDAEAEALLDAIDDVARTARDDLLVARLHAIQQAVAAPHARLRPRGATAEAASFRAVSRSVAREVALPTDPPRLHLAIGEAAIARAPVRLDLAGGWSDTPPICTELGGAVVNVAVALEGALPVEATARIIEEPVLRLESLDLGRRIELDDVAALGPLDAPGDWAALAKAALLLTGLWPRDPAIDLGDWLRAAGGGVALRFRAAVPKGSGLGTSSILGAALLACLGRAVGDEIAPRAILRRTSLLEQMIGAGGGWQDQAGGVLPGIKLLRSEPGRDQVPEAQRIDPAPEVAAALARRLLLYDTGRQRLARSILRGVVGRYLARDPATLDALRTLREEAGTMHDALVAGDLDAVAEGIARYWCLKKRLDPGATTPEIEATIAALGGDVRAATLCGAGGGGFLLLVARDDASAARLSERLVAEAPDPGGRLVPFAIDPTGLRVELA